VKYLILALGCGLGYLAANLAPTTSAQQQKAEVTPNGGVPLNPAIDFAGHRKVAAEAELHRQERRLTEEKFIEMAKEEGTIVLDARSKEMYDLLHVKGAINLSFPDIDIESLAKVLPDKKARILIYCNNNFTDPEATGKPAGGGLNARAREAMRPKRAVASLNISTYIALYSYGYKNVYELAPLVEPEKSKLAFESSKKPVK
jgi:hypothetical protein